MKRQIIIFLASIALGALFLIIARWLLPLMGLGGVDGEVVQPLARMTPAMVGVFLVSLAAIAILLWRDRRNAFTHSARLVEEVEQWNDFFVIGEDAGENPPTVQSDKPLPKLLEERAPEIGPGLDGASPIKSSTPVNESALSGESHAGMAVQAVAAAAAETPFKVSTRVTRNFRDRPRENFDREIEPAGDPAAAEPAEQAKSSPPRSPLHQLPPALPEFAGRSFELSELFAARANAENRILGLQGMGGVGKTTLAVKLAHQLVSLYPDSQIYIDLRGANSLPTPVSEAQAQIIRAYLPTARLPENEIELSRLYQAALSGKRALLLLDNAANAQQVAPLLPPDGCLTIVTSRQFIALQGMFISRLDSLPQSEAREMLKRLVPHIGNHADSIADLCGKLPLALRLAASAIVQNPQLSIDEYAERLSSLQKQEKPVRPIDAVLTTSYELLEGDLKRLWRMLAVFTDSFDVNAAASLWQVNPARSASALDHLMSYSLVERNRETGRFRLHDLMLHFAEMRLSGEERTVGKHRHSAHYQSVLHEADALYEQGGRFLKEGLNLLDLEWRNIQSGQMWAATSSSADRAACELCNSYPDAGRYVLDLRQHPRERIRWSEAALASAKILKRRKAAGRHLVSLGDSYADLSEVNHAIGFYEQALDLSRSINDRRGEADALRGLGIAYFLGGGLSRAREFHEASLEISRAIKDQRGETLSLGNLGLTHHALGEARTATVLFDQQLRIARESGDRRNESGALGGLGVAYHSLGDAERAVFLFDQQLEITREIGDRRGEAGALSNLGSAYASLKDYRKAIAFNEQSLAVSREIADRRREANALGGLGVAYYLSGDAQVGMQFLEHQLKLTAEINDQRGESLALINLGEAKAASGEAEKAVDLLERAFNITCRIGDIQGQGNALFNLALALDKLGDRKQAIEQAETALELFEIDRHPNLIAVEKQLEAWR